MRKLKLDLDAIAVASFTTAQSGSRRGTVLGAQDAAVYTQVEPETARCTFECQAAVSGWFGTWLTVDRGWGDLY